MTKKYSIDYFPKYKELIRPGLSEDQITVRIYSRKKPGKKKRCRICKKNLPLSEYYWKDKKKGYRSARCRDCTLKAMGVKEVGKLRFSAAIQKKGFKRCSDCKEIKPKTSFTKNRSAAGGINSLCYDCSKRRHDAWLKFNSDNLTDNFLKMYARKTGLKQFSKKTLGRLREEQVKKRAFKYFLDGLGFKTRRALAIYLHERYGILIATTEKRIAKGYPVEKLKISEFQARSEGHKRKKSNS